MKRTFVCEVGSCVGQEVMLRGWVSRVQNQKAMHFLILRDHSGSVQVVHERGGVEDVLSRSLDELTPESVVEIHGQIVESPQVKLGGVEIRLKELLVHSHAEGQLPVKPESSLDLRMDWRFLDLRQPRNRLLMEVQTTAEVAMREFWQQHGFLEIHSPKLMGAASEGGAELFQLPYFKLGKACLAQSPQFYKQMAMAAGLERIFEIGPVFRANPSFTSRHDTEFTSVDVEMSWITSHEELMAFEESWLQYVISRVASIHGEKIKALFGVDVKVPQCPFPRLTMAEAQDLLVRLGHIRPENTKAGDLDPEGERRIGRWIEEEYGHEFVFVTDYPISIRPFYHMRNGDVTKSFDLIWKGLEVTTGAQREHRVEVLAAQAVEKGVSEEGIKFYLDFFRFGCPPHGGFGFGLTRMLMVLLGVNNVREVTYIYRGPTRLHP